MRFFTISRDIGRAAVVWNAVASILAAVQSVVMVWLITRTLGEADGGVFALAMAQGYVLVTIGYYGVRRFQASDVARRVSFSQYVAARVVTCAVMAGAGAAIVAVNAALGVYAGPKAWAVALVVAFRLIDAGEDVVTGYLQQAGRLDVGSKITAARLATSTVAFLIALLVTRHLVWSLAVWVGVGLVSAVVWLRLALAGFPPDGQPRWNLAAVRQLLLACFPLFLAMFVNQFLGNAPKLAIDQALGDEAQARFNFLSMPSFVIQMLALFIFTPLIHQLSTWWVGGDLASLSRQVGRVLVWIGAIAAGCLALGALAGLPVLSWVFGVDLSGYLREFLVLLVGGAAVALAGFFTMILTIMRHQRLVMIGFGLPVALALSASWWVGAWGLWGAAAVWTATFSAQAVVLGIVFAVMLRRARRAGVPPDQP
jgi:O-antigen/teichoic acid export membrane protein